MNRKTRRTMKAKGIRMPRTEAEIRQEYQSLCMQAGECQFRIDQLENALGELNAKLISINKEFAALPRTEAPAEAPKAPEAVKPKPEVVDVQA